MAFSFGKRSVIAGLVSYLDIANPNSYPGSGTSITDLVYGGSGATLVGNTSYNNGYGGNILCDGYTGYVQPGGNVTSFTMDVVYSPLTFDTNPDTARYNCVVETNDGGTPGTMFLRYNTLISNTNMLLANHASSAEVSITVNHTVGQIYDAVITYDDTTKLVSVYFDGALNTSATVPTGLSYTGVKQLGYTFNMRLYSYRLYNRVLAANEVSQNYILTKSRLTT